MKLIKKVFLCCLIPLVFQSCTSVLFINTTLPPEVAVTNDQWKVITINRVNSELLPYGREKKIGVFTQATNEAFYGVTDAVLKDPTFSLTIADTTSKYVQTAPNQRLTPEQVQDIYRQYPHHLILALENFDAFFEQETIREKDKDGSVTKTAHYTLNTHTAWTLYDSTGNVLDHAVTMRRELYNTRGVLSGLLAVGPSISNAGHVMNRLAWQAGSDYWKRLHPKQVNFERLYYSSKDFTTAAFSMAASEWDKAITLLTPLAEGTNRKNAAKAAYNLAVVYEAKGNIAEAAKWAKQAADKGDKLALLLLPDLEKYTYK